MNKQNYEKPMASFIAFYSEKDLASEQSIADHVDTSTNTSITVGDEMDSNWK